MRLQQYISKNRGKFEKIKGVNIDENTVEVSKGYAGPYHILEMGQHYLEYRKPENLFPTLGESFKDFPTSKVFQKLENKTKAPIITGKGVSSISVLLSFLGSVLICVAGK